MSVLFKNPKTNFSYEIGVLHYEFDSSNDNVRLFNNKTERDTSFSLKIEKTNIVYNVPFVENVNITLPFEFESVDINNILNYNYCVIKTKENNYFYYFIVSTEQIAGEQVILNLSLDTIQTYYYDCDFPLATVHQAHIDRWIEKDSVYKFNNLSSSSPLLSNNLQDMPKFLKSRTKINAFFDYKKDSPINKLIEQENINWLYIYLNPNYVTPDSNILKFSNIKDGFDLGYIVFVAPIYTNPKGKKLYLWTNGNEKIDWDSNYVLNQIIKDTPNILNMKVSPISPFNSFEWELGVDYDLDDDNIIIKSAPYLNEKWNGYTIALIVSPFPAAGVLNIAYPSTIPNFNDYISSERFTFDNSEIKDKINNILLEPHLLSTKIKELNVVDYGGNSFTYDYQKIGKNIIRFLFTENWFLDISKLWVRYAGDNGTTFPVESSNNLTGLVSNNDTSLPYDVSQLQNFLANNKNFFQIRQNERDYKWLNVMKDAIVGAGIGISSGNPITGGIGGVVTGVISTAMDNNLSLKQQNLTIDNMRNAPDSIRNTTSSYLFDLNTDKEKKSLGIYIEHYTAIDQDIKKAFWTLFLNGYPLNIVDNPHNYDRSRVAFNFIKADIQVINAPVSNHVKQIIKNILSKGIRFWHMDTINYDVANYETNIDSRNKLISLDSTLSFTPSNTCVDDFISSDESIIWTSTPI